MHLPTVHAFSGSPSEILLLLAALSLLPFAVVMLTSFSKIVVVLSFVRSAMGSQQAPPAMVLTGLAALLTFHVMSPVLEDMSDVSRGASVEAMSGSQLVTFSGRVAVPLKAFLVRHGSAEERSRFVEMGRELRGPGRAFNVTEQDWSVVLPAFLLTELKTAFQLGFMVFLPFLVVDMVVANILLALGMQTLSPSQVSLPLKILLFVAVDGWSLLAKGLILGYR